MSVTPDADLTDRRTVTVNGAGFPPNSSVAFCQALSDGSPTFEDCGPVVDFVTASPSGGFSVRVTVRRLISVPSVGRTINCASESCAIAAAEDIINPVLTLTPISFAPGQPDGQLRNLVNGAIAGNNVYGDNGGAGQTRIRTHAPGTKAIFAVPFENDGLVTDDITIAAPATSAPIPARYFVGPYNVTAYVTGRGLTLSMDPGQILTLGVDFRISPTAPDGSRATSLITLTSDSAGSTDTVRVGVMVSSSLS